MSSKEVVLEALAENADDDLPALLEAEIVRTVSLDVLHQRAATEIRRLRASQSHAPLALTHEEIDRVAALTEKAMEDGLQGFMKTWGWQQFARTLVENLRPYGLRIAAQPEERAETAVTCGNGCHCLVQCGDTYEHSGTTKPPKAATVSVAEPVAPDPLDALIAELESTQLGRDILAAGRARLGYTHPPAPEGFKLVPAHDPLFSTRQDAKRYRWLRKQSSDIEAPRIDVVHWMPTQAGDANDGSGLRMEELDEAIDAAMAKADQT